MINSFNIYRPGAPDYTNGAIMGLNAEANEVEASGKTVIRMTAGQAKDDNGNIFGFEPFRKVVADVVNNTSANGLAAYSSPAGDPELAKMLKERILGDSLDKLPEGVSTSEAVVPGGTGALYTALSSLDGAIVTPKKVWPNIAGIIKQLPGEQRKVEKFNLLDSKGRFDKESFVKAINQARKSNKNINVLLVNPNANPQGLSFNESELEDLKQAFVDLDLHPDENINFINDTAYRELTLANGEVKKDIVTELPAFMKAMEGKNFNVVIANSASKMGPFFGLLRLGANVIVSANKDAVDNFKGRIGGAVRTSVSSVSTLSQAILKEVLKRENQSKAQGRE
ncbi:MAG: aminotransferase class I/II-fold pyridoxal phosphate-dependent enzyme [Candidatus Caenarcaniphilales bacterium]|nr:aminotransferase class I/II-fold pyridoxal phosphate-dependent enzyme [Candidatus Caenarcaniphilales bacterium]